MRVQEYSKEGLLDLIRPRKIMVGFIRHFGGPGTVFASFTHRGMLSEVAGYCLQHWPATDRPAVANWKLVNMFFRHYKEKRLETFMIGLNEPEGDSTWVAVVYGRSGYAAMTGGSKASVEERIAAWCRKGWRENTPLPEDSQAAIEAYFSGHPKRTYDNLLILQEVPIHP